MPDTDNKRSYKSLLIRYGTIFQGYKSLKIKDIVRYGESPRRITENKRKIKQIPDNQALSGISFFWDVYKRQVNLFLHMSVLSY